MALSIARYQVVTRRNPSQSLYCAWPIDPHFQIPVPHLAGRPASEGRSFQTAAVPPPPPPIPAVMPPRTASQEPTRTTIRRPAPEPSSRQEPTVMSRIHRGPVEPLSVKAQEPERRLVVEDSHYRRAVAHPEDTRGRQEEPGHSRRARSPSPPRRPVCRYFQQGHCWHGKQCRHEHGLMSPSHSSGRQQAPYHRATDSDRRSSSTPAAVYDYSQQEHSAANSRSENRGSVEERLSRESSSSYTTAPPVQQRRVVAGTGELPRKQSPIPPIVLIDPPVNNELENMQALVRTLTAQVETLKRQQQTAPEQPPPHVLPPPPTLLPAVEACE